MTSPLIDRLARRLGPAVVVSGPQEDATLWPDEAAAIARAIPARKVEFAAGRSAARAGLAALGHPAMAIPAGADRAPIWPKGIIGSITHTKGLCLAAVSRTSDTSALGIDAEQAAPLPQNILQTVLTEEDQRQLAAMPPLAATATFSAKEAVYKALSRYLDDIWDFDAMSIRLDPAANTFAAQLHRDAGPHKCGDTLPGVFYEDQNHILTAISLPIQA